jgi:hypothetical protein
VKHQEHGFRRIVVPGVLLVIVAWVTSGIGDDGSRRVVAAVAVLLACLTVGSLVVVGSPGDGRSWRPPIS